MLYPRYFLDNSLLPTFIIVVYLCAFWVPLPLDFAVLFLILGSTLSAFLTPIKNKQRVSLLDIYLIIFILSLLLSGYISGHSYRGLLVSSPFLPGILIYFIITRFINYPKDLHWVFVGISIMTGMIAMVVLVNYWLISNQTLISPVGLGTSILIVPNDILILSITSPLVLSMALSETNPTKEFIAKLVIIVSLAAIFSLNSRSASIAVLAGFFVVLLYFQGRGIFFIITSYIVVFFLINELASYSLANKLALEPGCDPRLPLWEAAINLWLQQPLLGHGIYSFGDLYREELKQIAAPICTLTDQRFTPWPHNLFLEVLVSQGIIGGVSLVLIFVWVFMKAYITSKDKFGKYRWHSIGMLGAATSFCLASSVELTFSRFWVVIIFMTLIGITSNFAANNKQQR